MIELHPSIDSIEAGYSTWLGRPARAVEGTAESALDYKPSEGPVPHAVADAIRRQVRARPAEAEPAPGDLVGLGASAGDDAEPQYAVVVALDRVDPADPSRWFGWLVGAHTDYAGDRDLVLDPAALGGQDPAPAAGMVLCWSPVVLPLGPRVQVLHRLSVDALTCVRALAAGASPSQDAPAPGRMCTRRVDGTLVVTGTPYAHDDPRIPYLELARDLARAVSQPSYDDAGRLRRPDPDGPER